MTILKSRLLWVLVVVVATVLTLVAWVRWSNNDSDFSLKADHTAVSVANGSQAVMAVSIKSKSSQPVRFSVAHAPAGITFSSITDSEASAHVAVLTFAANSSVKPGDYQVEVTGTSGSSSKTVPLSVHVPHVRPPFTFVIRPSSRTVVSRAKTYYTLVYRPGLPIRAASFTVTGLPANSTHSFTPVLRWPHQDAYRLNVSTTIDVAPGTYPFTVHVTAGSDSADAQGYLIVVNAVIKNFTISGDGAKLLAPGITSPINLAISNNFKRSLTVAGLSVSLVSTSNPACTTSNFVVNQYSGPSTLVVPAHTKQTLSQLGVPRSQWPSVKMVNLLHTNQDVCKNVTLNLTYTGSGSGT